MIQLEICHMNMNDSIVELRIASRTPEGLEEKEVRSEIENYGLE